MTMIAVANALPVRDHIVAATRTLTLHSLHCSATPRRSPYIAEGRAPCSIATLSRPPNSLILRRLIIYYLTVNNVNLVYLCTAT